MSTAKKTAGKPGPKPGKSKSVMRLDPADPQGLQGSVDEGDLSIQEAEGLARLSMPHLMMRNLPPGIPELVAAPAKRKRGRPQLPADEREQRKAAYNPTRGVRCSDDGWAWAERQATKAGYKSIAKWFDGEAQYEVMRARGKKSQATLAGKKAISGA